ncbi:MAG: HAMP domain-containing sensor histidine kinase [Eubacteriales bacterium]
MKLRTRLIITFIAMIVMPLALTSIAFFILSHYMFDREGEGLSSYMTSGVEMTDAVNNFAMLTDETYQYLLEEAGKGNEQLEEMWFLEEIDAQLYQKSSYLVMFKGDDLYYIDKSYDSDSLQEWLPDYRTVDDGIFAGYYYSDIRTYVKCIEYSYSDGDNGCIFVITKVNDVVAKELMIDMAIAVALVLLFTSYMLTRWIYKGIFVPIRELSEAMGHISSGNFEHTINTTVKGEIGDLYHNYEEMRLRLRESTEEKSTVDRYNRELISNISHDLKTPITAIKGYVEGIMDGVADTPEKQEKYVKTIYHKANDMDKLINELTLYSKIDANKIPYNFHKLNVSAYFGDCVDELGLDLEDKEIELEYMNMVDPAVTIIADPEQIKRVINNIISNSIKYINKAKGIIAIRILDDMDSIRVEIEDNGIGVATQDLEKIFERFYRTDASRNSSRGGSGIGLSIVKKIIEDHGGYIWATSKEKEGTCIQFVIKKYGKDKEHE